MAQFPEMTRIGMVVSARTRRGLTLARKAFHYDNANYPGTRKVRIDIRKNGQRLAPLVDVLTGNPVITRDGMERIHVEIPMVGNAAETDINDYFRQLEAGKSEFTEQDYRNFYNRIIDDTKDIDDRIARTEEYMAAELLKWGVVTLKGVDGAGQALSFKIDYRRAEELTIILSGSARWGQSGVSAYNSLLATSELVAEKGYMTPSCYYLGEEALDKFLFDAKTKDVMSKSVYAAGQLTLKESGDAEKHVAFVPGIGDIFKYTAGYVDPATNTHKKYIPANGVLMFNEQAENHTFYGGIPVSRNGAVAIECLRRVVSHTVTDRQPVREFLDVNAAPLMVLGEPDTTAYMEV